MRSLKDSGEPFYLQIAERLRELIGTLSAGERLPSEPQLAKQFSVSRFTVAKAVEQLVNDGLITRKQGSGTFVAEAPLRREPGYLLSFTEAVEAAGHKATHQVLALKPTAWEPDLPYGEGESLLLFDRLRLVDGVPVARHRSILSARIVAEIGLTQELAATADFSLYRRFEQCGLTVATARERLVARLASAEERRLLSLNERSVVVSVQRQTYSADGMVLDAVNAVYDARSYAYEARLSRQHDLGNQKIKMENGNEISSLQHDDHHGPRLGPWGDGQRSG
ncbi:GntR family transcriptional regulator [Rhizobium alvei]|uniref:GntR family transcriptional regulator n=1 Tax=Rhizobium alvei TaxID=1132659 RepID=A0ABT8YTJ9_9HYPH|nr:GntR family transcriptional regulator [Rhizobium alvei]MDO6966845.1 GntR family transcriptional regulator [Rhizobium alvei]